VQLLLLLNYEETVSNSLVGVGITIYAASHCWVSSISIVVLLTGKDRGTFGSLMVTAIPLLSFTYHLGGGKV
jgi:hypothetical protein